MSKLLPKLTPYKIKKPEKREYKISNGQRLYIVVEPNGRKWWMYKYMYNGKRTQKFLGNYPEISLAKARELREKYRELELKNTPPSMLKHSNREQFSLKKIYFRIFG